MTTKSPDLMADIGYLIFVYVNAWVFRVCLLKCAVVLGVKSIVWIHDQGVAAVLQEKQQ